MRRLVLAAALLTLVAGCSGSDDSAAEPKPDFEVPSGVTLTDPGATLAFGEGAAVGYPDPGQTALTLRVDAIAKAKPADLRLYNVSGTTGKQAYYVTVTMGNRGPADATFPDGLPWWVHVDGDVLVPPSTMPAGFTACAAPKTGSPMPVGRATTGCLVFFVARATTIESVDFQPGDVTTAVRWRQ